MNKTMSLPRCDCSNYTLSEGNLDNVTLYNNPEIFPTIDRPKPLYRKSQVLVEDGGCDAQTEAWACPSYAFNSCEHLYKEEGFAEEYLQCLDDRLTACRAAANCNYRAALTPEACQNSCNTNNQSLTQLIQNACQGPHMEFPDWKSYQNCVDRMTRWENDGCGNMPADTWGPVTNIGTFPPSRNGRYSGSPQHWPSPVGRW